MSGGSMDYVCYHVEDASRMCDDVELAELLRDAANVLHDEEWWKSCDYSEDVYRESLAEFKEKWFKGNRAERLKGYVDKEIGRCRKQCYSIIGPVTADGALRGEGDTEVKPRTIEDVLFECGDEYHKALKSDYTFDPADIFRKYADEISELIGGGAE